MGVVFNIQKFSIHDGPGIRTNVFLKGCPLHCPWCSNPESQNSEIELIWDNTKCCDCNSCVNLYDNKLSFIKDKKFINVLNNRLVLCTVNEKEAQEYKACCPTNALSYEGYTMSVEEVMSEVAKDIPFYLESGGGLTLSGGEVLYQSSFAIEILKAARDKKIHTACETTCLTTPKVFHELIKYVDLLLCDIKHYDEDIHKTVIGSSLDFISENIKYATSLKQVEVIGRIPVIPGFNYSIEDAHGLSKRLLDLGIHKVNLLPYHNYGENKYALLERPYTCIKLENLKKDTKEFVAYENVFRSYGILLE
ncbi:MAG: glycyl-radical enzyme activating protein [Longicatena sp.]